MTRTVKAIARAELDEAMARFGRDGRNYFVMVAHAGRSDRTGAKVHMASLTVWPDGRATLSGTNCSANGQLRGALVEGRDFGAVTCKKCGATDALATFRNGKAIDLTVNQ